jgi:hypothetical protein
VLANVLAIFSVNVGGIDDVSEIIPASSCRRNYFKMTHVDIVDYSKGTVHVANYSSSLICSSNRY